MMIEEEEEGETKILDWIGCCDSPLIPNDVLPAFTAFSAYSICTNLPDGLKVVREKSAPLMIDE